MIRRYRFGNPLETDAIVNKPELSQGGLPYFEKRKRARV